MSQVPSISSQEESSQTIRIQNSNDEFSFVPILKRKLLTKKKLRKPSHELNHCVPCILEVGG